MFWVDPGQPFTTQDAIKGGGMGGVWRMLLLLEVAGNGRFFFPRGVRE